MPVTVYRQAGAAAGQYPSRPIGFVLHGSRSGLPRGVDAEFDGTRAYAASKPPIYDRNGTIVGYLCWQATIGNRAYSVHMGLRSYGWHARAASSTRIGLEFAQANLGDAITDRQIDSFVAFYRNEVVPVWGAFNMDDDKVLATHAEVERWGETGAADGKSDLAPYRSPMADDVRRRIRAAL